MLLPVKHQWRWVDMKEKDGKLTWDVTGSP